MERHANYVLVGVLTTLLVIGGLVFAVWLGGFEFGRGADRYKVIFVGPVSGMAKGTEVQFNGIKVGEVERIALLPENSTLIEVDVMVQRDTPVRDDSVASPESQGISGVNIVQITAGTVGRPLLRQVDRSERPRIRSKPGGLSSLLAGGARAVEGVNEALLRVNRLLSDGNIAALAGTMQELRSVTSELARNRAMFADASSAIDKLDRAAGDVQAAARSTRGIIDGDGRRSVAELRATLGEARTLIRTLNGSAGQLGSSTLPGINATMLSLQQTSDSLDGLIRQIRQDPRGIVGKPRGKELELRK